MILETQQMVSFERRLQMSGDFNAKLGREEFFQMIGNESPHSDSNDNCVRIVNFATQV